ncbi:MAG: N-acetylmuramoyl-L-alanine amidase [Candidatus Sumerlaeia bacterium]|nr:N-acetylmuramoyl-L-alanine amidase [Candidatus Sumerlaeia bacterium]
MHRLALVLTVLLGALSSACAWAEAPASAPVAPPEIVESRIAANCYNVHDGVRSIDTVVVHYASAIYWFDPSFQRILGDEGRAYAESIGLTRENLAQHKYDWQLVKPIFEAYKVSAHYIIARDGTIVRLVPDNDRAWHAGQSTMPTDGRQGVNNFSIGIELMSSHPKDDPTVVTPQDAYTEAQYASLTRLIAMFCEKHPITAVVGHDEIAPGRKTDPGPLFQWGRVRTPDYRPLACVESASE